MPDTPFLPDLISRSLSEVVAPNDCSHCNLATLCLPFALDNAELVQLENIIKHKSIRKGAHLYREREAFSAIYVVKRGAFKSYRVSGSGVEEVVGFYYPGEILGVDGISTYRCASSSLALEAADVCVVQFDDLNTLSTAVPTLQRRFFQLISQEIARDQQLISILGKNTAEQRVAALLHSISIRNQRRQLPADRLTLPMTRADIGSYLGVSTESVSRMLTQLQHEGIMTIDGREVVIHDLKKLRGVAGGCLEAE